VAETVLWSETLPRFGERHRAHVRDVLTGERLFGPARRYEREALRRERLYDVDTLPGGHPLARSWSPCRVS